jgi:23S rRNA (uracil1939-C5)-methyltransferase
VDESPIEVRTTPHLAAGGDAIARAPDGRVVFVEGAAPDERVEAEVVQANPSFLRARVLRVIERSPARAEPPCPHFGTCGGCTLQHVTPEAQRASKQRAFIDTLRRIGHLDPAKVEIESPWSGEPYGYRTRARFSIGPRGEVGFRGLRSRAVVDVDRCLILSPPIQRALEAIHRAEPPGPGEIEAIANETEHRIEGLDPGDPIDANDGLGPLFLEPTVFAQSNRAGNAAMAAYIESLIAGEPIEEAIELYSGSGNFTRILARGAKRVRAYEPSARAHANAEKVRPSNAQLVRLDAESALAAVKGPIDLLLVDPPRTGMSLGAVELARTLAARRLIYVSCDPATFARDVSRLAGTGTLELAKARLFDLYPQTAHAEVIGLVRRRES